MPKRNERKDKEMKTDRQPAGKLTVGYNSTMKLIKSGEAEKVLLAYDCSEFIRQNVVDAASSANVKTDEKYSMAQLGAMCGIDVGCAVCAVRK